MTRVEFAINHSFLSLFSHVDIFSHHLNFHTANIFFTVEGLVELICRSLVDGISRNLWLFTKFYSCEIVLFRQLAKY